MAVHVYRLERLERGDTSIRTKSIGEMLRRSGYGTYRILPVNENAVIIDTYSPLSQDIIELLKAAFFVYEKL